MLLINEKEGIFAFQTIKTWLCELNGEDVFQRERLFDEAFLLNIGNLRFITVCQLSMQISNTTGSHTQTV